MHESFNHLSTTCPFCNSKAIKSFSTIAHDSPVGTATTVALMECTTCIAAWQWPRHRSTAESQDIFNTAYDEKATGTYFDESRRVAVGKYQAAYLTETINIKSAKLLDIGCGDGIFAKEMAAKGWTVTGVDPALPEACELLSSDNLIFKRELATPNSTKDLFDVVTLMDVIEHIEDPNFFLKYAISFLRPGGLLIVETGNYQSTARIENANTWWNYQLDHRWYFSPPQLEGLLKKSGMHEIILADKVLRPWVKTLVPTTPKALPELICAIKAMLRNPTHPLSALEKYRKIANAKQSWPHWHHLEIFTMIARKPIH